MPKLSGTCALAKDGNGQNYLRLQIDPGQCAGYEAFMRKCGLGGEVERKMARDDGQYHITLANAIEWGRLTKHGRADELLSEVDGRQFEFATQGIGRVESKGNQAYFVIADNPEFQAIRQRYGMDAYDFHVTLGFAAKDVIGVSKGPATCVFPDAVVHGDALKAGGSAPAETVAAPARGSLLLDTLTGRDSLGGSRRPGPR